MAKVLYRQGTKATYLALLEKNPSALYFCTDTKELFKGEDLYSDGLRIIDSYTMLPPFSIAADGILYFCSDNGCGYVLNATRDGWMPVIHGVDNETIGVNENGLLCVKVVPIGSVSGLSEKLENIDAGLADLDERIQSIEQIAVGGVHYRGAVNTFEDLPTVAEIGDLYEVYEDNSEWCWNGEKWFEYGKTSEISDTYVTKDEAKAISKMVEYEISHKPIGTLINYYDSEIRVMCPADTKWVHQTSGVNSEPNKYYIGFKAYAPNENVVSFKEALAESVTDSTMYYFENNEFAGIDQYGRKYSIVWLPVANYDEGTGTWTYFGKNSTSEKYIGWHYSVEWFDVNGVKVAADRIRINLSNEDCFLSAAPSYVASLQSQIAELEESYAWGDM